MRKLLLAAVALGGLTALATTGAVADPAPGRHHWAPPQPTMTQVDYYHNHHHWHHRHWEHNHYRYYD